MKNSQKCFAVILAVGLLLSGLCACGQLSPALTIDSLSRQLDSGSFEGHTVVIGDVEYFEDAAELAALFMLSEWEECEKPADEPLLLTVHLAELYEIYVYESYARVYYGYASVGKSENVCYSIPEAAAENIRAYIDGIS